MAALGTLAWAAQTGGRLSIGERLRLLGEGIAVQIASLPAVQRRRAGLEDERLTRIELPERPPDSRVAREAEELSRELSSEALLNHCLRTYVWGELLGRRDSLSRDEELLYVACMLHDLGLTERHCGRDPDSHCFAVEGARAAARFLQGAGWERPRTEGVEEAICLHLNPNVPLEYGAEAHLLARGAAYDVMGRDLAGIPEAARAPVLERHPRVGIKRELDEAMRRQSEMRPDSRMGFYCRFGGFRRTIRRAPFES